MFKDFESDMAVKIRQLGNPTQKTAERHGTAKQTAGSSILNLLLHVKKSNLLSIAGIFVKLYTTLDCKD